MEINVQSIQFIRFEDQFIIETTYKYRYFFALPMKIYI